LPIAGEYATQQQSALPVAILARFTAELEIYSIDEAFLRVSPKIARDPDAMTALGREIKDTLHRLIGVPVCVGIAETRTQAKLANRAAKKIAAFEGVCVWPATRPEWRQQLMSRLPVSEVWGIASRLERRLVAMGISSIADLAAADPVRIRKAFNVVVMRTALELRGVPSIVAEEDRTGRKEQLIVSRSFSEKVPLGTGCARRFRSTRSRRRPGWCATNRSRSCSPRSRGRRTTPSSAASPR
jgi:DNA polymerase V